MGGKYLHDGLTDQSKAGRHRLKDSRALLQAGRWRGAMYLAGYAVECQLKVQLMTRHGCRTLRALEETLRDRGLLDKDETLFDHKLERFLNIAQATDRYRRDPREWLHFAHVNRWMTAWRYDPDESSHEDASGFLDEVEHVLRWIKANI